VAFQEDPSGFPVIGTYTKAVYIARNLQTSPNAHEQNPFHNVSIRRTRHEPSNAFKAEILEWHHKVLKSTMRVAFLILTNISMENRELK
jgi:hypothetical protein